MLCGRSGRAGRPVGSPVGAQRGRERGAGRSGVSRASGRPRSWLMSFDRSWPSDQMTLLATTAILDRVQTQLRGPARRATTGARRSRLPTRSSGCRSPKRVRARPGDRSRPVRGCDGNAGPAGRRRATRSVDRVHRRLALARSQLSAGPGLRGAPLGRRRGGIRRHGPIGRTGRGAAGRSGGARPVRPGPRRRRRDGRRYRRRDRSWRPGRARGSARRATHWRSANRSPSSTR